MWEVAVTRFYVSLLASLSTGPLVIIPVALVNAAHLPGGSLIFLDGEFINEPSLEVPRSKVIRGVPRGNGKEIDESLQLDVRVYKIICARFLRNDSS